jgi:hypothetical protein
MVSRTTFATAIAATLWSPAVSDELRPMQYKIRVLEQVRHEITVEADQEWGGANRCLIGDASYLGIAQSSVETVAANGIGACE